MGNNNSISREEYSKEKDKFQKQLDSAVSDKNVLAQKLVRSEKELQEAVQRLTERDAETKDLKEKLTKRDAETKDLKEKLTKRDAETKDLKEKLNVVEGKMKSYEQQSHEISSIAETRKLELEETHLKLKHLETIVEELQTKSSHFEKETGGLAETNLKLTQELALYKSKLGDLEAKLYAAHAEKNETVEQLHTSKKAIEDLTQQLKDEGQRLQSQISSVMEENNMLNEAYQKAKEELQSVIFQLEEQLKVQKANEDALEFEIENIKAEGAEKLALLTSLYDLIKKLTMAEAQLNQLKEEVASVEAAAGKCWKRDLTQQLKEEGQRLQSQISSVMEENNMLNEAYQKAKEELQSVIFQLEEQLKVQKANEDALKFEIENLKAEGAEKLALLTSLYDLKKKLTMAEAQLNQLKEEVASVEAAAGKCWKRNELANI